MYLAAVADGTKSRSQLTDSRAGAFSILYSMVRDWLSTDEAAVYPSQEVMMIGPNPDTWVLNLIVWIIDEKIDIWATVRAVDFYGQNKSWFSVPHRGGLVNWYFGPMGTFYQRPGSSALGESSPSGPARAGFASQYIRPSREARCRRASPSLVEASS